jgi:hypothetical protein
MPDGAQTVARSSPGLFDLLPPDVLAGLTAEQRRALAVAARQSQGGRPPVNLRFSVPILRFYLTILAGPERRSRGRLAAERHINPVRTAGNFVFVVATAFGFYAAATFAILFYSSIIVF